MGDTVPPDGWIPLDIDAARVGIHAEILLRWIKDGRLEGARFSDGWYVAPPLVTLEPPTTADDQTARLTLCVCRLGPYLTAGRGRYVIALQLDDPAPSHALARLNEAMRRIPELPLTVKLAGQRLLVDSSFWCDLAAALVGFDVLQNDCIEELLLDDGSEELKP
jgi:hypothetical protein